jgi:hypothetical protein
MTVECLSCGRKNHTIEMLQAELNSLAEELAGARQTLKTLERQVTAYKTEVKKLREGEPGADDVKELLEAWRERTGRTRRTKINMDGERAKVTRQALKQVDGDKELLLLALDGIVLKPYVGPRGRQPFGTDKQRYDQPQHCWGTEDRIENNVKIARAARQAAVDKHEAMVQLWLRAQAQEQLFGQLVVDALGRNEPTVVAAVRHVDFRSAA